MKPNENIVILCGKDGCKFKHSNENKYCRKHQICIFEDETKSLGKKTCFNYIRGCRNQLDIDYKFSKCQICLEKDRCKDKERRQKIVKEIENITCEITENLVSADTTKNCTTCFKNCPMDFFIGLKKQITKTCKICRDSNKKQDLKRDKEHRKELARKNDSNPERIAVKKQWKEDNYEKVAEYWMNSREKKMETIGVEEYLKKNADDAKNWRDKNNTKVFDNNEYKKNSIQINYSNYIRNANYKNLEFNITIENFNEIVKNPCYYCRILQPKGFNGIDRKDQTKGYIVDNCVSCCKMCNYIKGSLNDDIFVRRIEHILKYNNLINGGNLYPECFANHNTLNYSRYKNRALHKELDFLLSHNDYNNIVNNNCYMCGKENDEFHKNGIDRFDSNKGYILENTKPCCGECNYMKRDYEYNEFINKLQEIYENHKNNVLSNSMLVENNKNIVENKNKKSKEEILSITILRKQKQIENLKEKYSNTEYKKLRAKEIAKNRKEKMGN
jgi:hypothetical protein